MEVVRRLALKMMLTNVGRTCRSPGVCGRRIGLPVALRVVVRSGAVRRRRLQLVQERGEAIVLNPGSLRNGSEIGDHSRYAVLTAALEKSHQVRYQMVSAIARASPRFG
jgi:hypothetical protein